MSVIVKQDRHITAEELYSSPEFTKFKKVELWRGNPVVMSPTQDEHSKVLVQLVVLLNEHLKQVKDLNVGIDSLGFLLRRNPDLLLCPDVSVYHNRQVGKPWIEKAPLVAIEVLSPNNNHSEMMAKKEDYFENGCEQFWLVDPEKRSIDVYHSDRQVECLSKEARLEFSSGVLKGFVLDLNQVFALLDR